MTAIVLVESSGLLKSLKAKDLTEETLYKKCGFRNADHFAKRATWTALLKSNENITVSLWAKDDGKANYANKYALPNPVDKTSFYGPCTLVRTVQSTIVDLPLDMWTEMYDLLTNKTADENKDETANVIIDKNEEEIEEELASAVNIPVVVDVSPPAQKKRVRVENKKRKAVLKETSPIVIHTVAPAPPEDEQLFFGEELTPEPYL